MKSLLSLDEYIDINQPENTETFYTYFIFDNNVPIDEDGFTVPLTAFFSDQSIGNKVLELPHNVDVDTFNGFMAFVVKNEYVAENEYIEVNVDDYDSINYFLSLVKFKKYSREEIANAVSREMFPDVYDDEE